MKAKEMELQNLRKVALTLMGMGVYTILDYTKFCEANKLSLF